MSSGRIDKHSMEERMYSVGIIGAGFVGTAICKAFQHYTDVKIYDKFKDMGFKYTDVVNQDILFVCLPTPMMMNHKAPELRGSMVGGHVDLSVLDGALGALSRALPEDDDKIVIIKSTIPPGSCKYFSVKYKNLIIAYSPEFLTERTADLDFIQQNRIIVGTGELDGMYERRITELFKTRFPKVPIKFVSWDEASLIKYFTNVFFCVKISLFNEFAQIAEKLGLDANEVAAEVLNDGRIGRSHWQVPGHDGHRGFGGSCFPKDINGYMQFAKELDILPKMAEAAWDTNIEVRPEKDWEKLKGRAVS